MLHVQPHTREVSIESIPVATWYYLHCICSRLTTFYSRTTATTKATTTSSTSNCNCSESPALPLLPFQAIMSCDHYILNAKLVHSFSHMNSFTRTRATKNSKTFTSTCIASTEHPNNAFNLMIHLVTYILVLCPLFLTVMSHDAMGSPQFTSITATTSNISSLTSNVTTINYPSALQLTSSSSSKSSPVIKCDFSKYTSSGCPDRSSCNKVNNNCECSITKYPFNVHGRCVGYAYYNDQCLTSKQCVPIKGLCFDPNGQEVTALPIADAKEVIASHSVYPSVGTCRCPENLFYSYEKRECIRKVLGRRCTFHTECFHRSHSYCDGSKCKCKPTFVHDSTSDECRPSQWSLCIFHPNGTRNCRDFYNESIPGSPIVSGGTFIPGSVPTSLSALFWPIIAFFLVILLLKMLKEGMRRDCDNIGQVESDVPYNNVQNGSNGHRTYINGRHSSSNGNRNRVRSDRSHGHNHRHHHHHNSIRIPFVSSPYPPDFASSIGATGGTGSVTTPLTSTPNSSTTLNNDQSRPIASINRDTTSPAQPHEIIVLMPPPPYSVTPNTPSNEPVTTSVVTSGILEEPPSYEEATRK